MGGHNITLEIFSQGQKCCLSPGPPALTADIPRLTLAAWSQAALRYEQFSAAAGSQPQLFSHTAAEHVQTSTDLPTGVSRWLTSPRLLRLRAHCGFKYFLFLSQNIFGCFFFLTSLSLHDFATLILQYDVKILMDNFVLETKTETEESDVRLGAITKGKNFPEKQCKERKKADVARSHLW